jgi:hypothetical protein
MLQVFDVLAAVVAGGQQAFTLPDSRPFWQQLFNSQAPYQDHTWQVLDLSEVRHLYKDAQKRETLFRQHRKAQRQLDAAAQAAAEREEAAKRSRGFSFGLSSSSSGTGGAAQEAADAAAERKSVRPSSLHEFLIVSEVLKPLGETPRDLLEDSYAIITRDGRCAGYTYKWLLHEWVLDFTTPILGLWPLLLLRALSFCFWQRQRPVVASRGAKPQVQPAAHRLS